MKRFCLFMFFLSVVACEKIPENPVYGEVLFSFYLQDRDKVLRGVNEYKTFIPGINYFPKIGEKLGLGGLLVVHTPFIDKDEFCAFDLACPNELNPNRNTIVEVDKDGINAICPKCGTKYQIFDGFGLALNGKYGLRMYHVSLNGSTGVVTN